VPKPFTKEQQTALVAVTLLLAPLLPIQSGPSTQALFQVENRGGTYVMAGASGYSLEAQYMAGSLLAAWLLVKGFRWVTLLPIVPYVLYRTYAGMSRWTIVLLFLLITLIYAWQRTGQMAGFVGHIVRHSVFFLFKSIGDNRQWLADRWAGKVQETPAVQSVQDKLKNALRLSRFRQFRFSGLRGGGGARQDRDLHLRRPVFAAFHRANFRASCGLANRSAPRSGCLI